MQTDGWEHNVPRDRTMEASEQGKIKFAASMCLQAECMQRVTRHPDEHGPDASAFYENMPVRALRGDRCQL